MGSLFIQAYSAIDCSNVCSRPHYSTNIRLRGHQPQREVQCIPFINGSPLHFAPASKTYGDPIIVTSDDCRWCECVDKKHKTSSVGQLHGSILPQVFTFYLYALFMQLHRAPYKILSTTCRCQFSCRYFQTSFVWIPSISTRASNSVIADCMHCIAVRFRRNRRKHQIQRFADYQR